MTPAPTGPPSDRYRERPEPARELLRAGFRRIGCPVCGIAGQLSDGGPLDLEDVIGITRALGHRGPDDWGHWEAPDRSVTLGHRRLSVLDLSAHGRQPMVSPSQRHVIVFNGEIYNFRGLRRDLEASGEHFATGTDTEVVLRLWELMGPASLGHLRGMYAFAIWDSGERQLFLARDPLGIKPLYYRTDGCVMSFASEVRPLAGVGSVSLDPDGLGAFLKWGSIPAPMTTYREVRAVPAGMLLTFGDGRCRATRHWSLADAWARSVQWCSSITTYGEALEAVRSSLEDSVRAHLVSDVPVGAFLSGGLDSLALVALMRRTGQAEIDTFTIGSDDPALDEVAAARGTAAAYGTNHHEWRVTSAELTDLLPGFLAAMDQPTIDGFNTYVVSHLAHSNGIKVVTSGIGGDELFRGYEMTFRRLPTMARVLRNIPLPMRSALSAQLTRAPSHRGRRLSSLFRQEPTLRALYLWSRQLFHSSEIPPLFVDPHLGKAASEVDLSHLVAFPWPHDATAGSLLAALEIERYLCAQLLPDSDTFSMAHSLELRTPLVDATLYEKLLALPERRLEKRGAGKKHLLAEAAGVSLESVYRKKRGFTLPFRRWMEDWKDFEHFPELFDARHVDQMVSAVSTGQLHWARLWSVRMLSEFLRSAGTHV